MSEASKTLALKARKTGAREIRVGESRAILVPRLDAIGDLVLMSPFLRELRQSNLHAWITLVVDPRFLNVVELCPYVNEVLGFDPRKNRLTGRFGVRLRALEFAITRLWKRKFDLALQPRWDVDSYFSTFVMFLSRARDRVGFSEKVSPLKHLLNQGYDAFLTHALNDSTAKHEAMHNLDLLRAAGGTVNDDRLEVWLDERDREFARNELRSCGIHQGDLLIGLAPGAAHPKRRWPVDRFFETGRFLDKEYGARLVIVGGLGDREASIELKEKLGSAAVSFSGETTLRQTAAILEQVQLLVANDSGPMHLAAAAGAAVLEISCHPAGGDPSHANSPVRFHPWTKDFAVLQPPKPAEPCSSACEWHDAHCILGVSSDAAKIAAKDLLGRKGEWRASLDPSAVGPSNSGDVKVG